MNWDGAGVRRRSVPRHWALGNAFRLCVTQHNLTRHDPTARVQAMHARVLYALTPEQREGGRGSLSIGHLARCTVCLSTQGLLSSECGATQQRASRSLFPGWHKWSRTNQTSPLLHQQTRAELERETRHQRSWSEAHPGTPHRLTKPDWQPPPPPPPRPPPPPPPLLTPGSPACVAWRWSSHACERRIAATD